MRLAVIYKNFIAHCSRSQSGRLDRIENISLFGCIGPLPPRSNKHLVSPYNVVPESDIDYHLRKKLLVVQQILFVSPVDDILRTE